MRNANDRLGAALTHRLPRILAAIVLAGAAVTMHAGAAHATPLIVNGGFEADTTNGGIVSPPTGWTASGDAGADSAFPFAGSNNGFIGIGELAQTVSTTPAASYTLSFELAPDPTTLLDSAATMTVTFGGQVLAAISSTAFASTAYSPFSYQFTAGSTASTLQFDGFTTGDAGNWFLDAVALSANVVETPEPSSAAIIGGALAMLGLARAARRRRQGV